MIYAIMGLVIAVIWMAVDGRIVRIRLQAALEKIVDLEDELDSKNDKIKELSGKVVKFEYSSQIKTLGGPITQKEWEIGLGHKDVFERHPVSPEIVMDSGGASG